MATASAQSARAAVREMRSRSIPHTIEAPPARVVWSLGRVEAREMLQHPAYLVGFGLSLVLVGVPRGGVVRPEFVMAGLAVALVLGSLFAADLGALRSRRDGTDELFGSTPAPLAARTAAHLVAVWLGPVVVTCLWTVAMVILDAVDPTRIPDLELLTLLQAPLVVAAIGTLGVATARWIPHVVGGAVILALHIFTPLFWALPWAVFEPDELSVNLWHLGYLGSMIVVLSSAAFLRDRARVLPAVAFAAGLGAAIVSAVQRVPQGGW
jgi:hypothetical protein